MRQVSIKIIEFLQVTPRDVVLATEKEWRSHNSVCVVVGEGCGFWDGGGARGSSLNALKEEGLARLADGSQSQCHAANRSVRTCILV